MKISTVFLGVVTLAIVGAWFAPLLSAEEEATYVGNKQCKVCHNKPTEGEQWNKWKAQKHATAFQGLQSDKAKEIATRLNLPKPPAETPECLQCHVTAYKTPDKLKEGEKPVPDTINMEDGVQCETCHGPASLHVKDGKQFKTTKDSSIDMSAHIKRSDEKLCVTCHNEKSPTWNPEQYTLEDGKKVGFDFKQAWAKISHERPKEEKKAQ